MTASAGASEGVEDTIEEAVPADPAAIDAGDETAVANAAARRDTGARGVVRNSALMAVAAVVSRVTGLLAKIFITAVLAFSVVNDSYTLANTLPNIVFELLLGGVLTSVAIPLLTRARKDPDGGAAYTQQLMTLSLVGTVRGHRDRGAGRAGADRAVPGLGFPGQPGAGHPPGVPAAAADLLLRNGRFVRRDPEQPGTVRRTGVGAGGEQRGGDRHGDRARVLAWAGSTTSWPPARAATPIYGDPTATQFLILGLGTTAGIVAQAAVMLPSLHRVGFRFKWRLGWDRRMSEALGLAGWAVVYVLVSQVGYIAFTLLAGRVEGGISQYYWANLLFQTPYGILGVSGADRDHAADEPARRRGRSASGEGGHVAGEPAVGRGAAAGERGIPRAGRRDRRRRRRSTARSPSTTPSPSGWPAPGWPSGCSRWP